MRQWIETAEFIFQTATEAEEKSKIDWFFPINE